MDSLLNQPSVVKNTILYCGNLPLLRVVDDPHMSENFQRKILGNVAQRLNQSIKEPSISESLMQRFISVDVALPSPAYQPYYEDDYSAPVLVVLYAQKTGQALWRYSHRYKGWVLADLPEGPRPSDYDPEEYGVVTHWMPIPEFTPEDYSR